MASYVQVIGTGAAPSHVPPCLLLSFPHARFLFGAGEGTQRAGTEGSVKLSKMSQVFLTRIQHEQVGGLTGLLITLADLGLKRVGVHAPGPLRHFLQAARFVSVRTGMTIDACEVTQPTGAGGEVVPRSVCFEDENLSVEVLVLAKQRVFLPPIRSLSGRRPPQKAQRNAAVASPSAADSCEPVDPSIDDSAAPSSTDASTASPIVPPAAKKAKFTHADRSAARPPASASSAAHSASAAASSSSAMVPPRTLSYMCVNTDAESARRHEEWEAPADPVPSLASYIVSLVETPGKFDLARAKALGIPPGPLYAKLKAGESIQLRASEMMGAPGVGGRKKPPQQGKKNAQSAPAPAPAVVPPVSVADDPLRTFHPSDCVAPPTPGPQFAVVDCPNEAFIDSLVTHKSWTRFQQQQDKKDAPAVTSAVAAAAPPAPLSLMVHLTPLSLLSHPRYVAWLSSFGPSTQHILLHATTSIPQPVFRCAALNYLKLQRYINGTIFPARMPIESDDTPEGERNAEARAVQDRIARLFPASLRVAPGSTNMRFQLLPPQNVHLDRSLVPAPLQSQDVLANLKESSNPALIAKLERWKDAMERGSKEGKGVQQVAEELKQQMDKEEKEAQQQSDAPHTDAAPASSSPSPTNIQPDIPLLPAPALAAYPAVPDILAQLAAEPESRSPELVFLGTGSAIPSKYRNVTGQFFHPGYEALAEGTTDTAALTHPVGGFFFDCGEGSYGQLCLRYASPAAPLSAQEIVANLIADLKCVWVSHIHADHHLGLLTILAVYKDTWMRRYKERHGDQCDTSRMELVSPLQYAQAAATATSASSGPHHLVPRLLVVGPRRLFFWLQEYASCAFEVAEVDQIPLDAASTDAMSDAPPSAASALPSPPRNLFDWVTFVGCSELQDRQHVLSEYFAGNAPALQERYPHIKPRSLSVMHTVQVKHCHDAYGLVIETSASGSAAPSVSASTPALPPYKLVISGDTQPCQELVNAGADASLLVHEATLEDELLQDARDKRHSTTSQAVEVGLAMRAQRILLTHFSQRYPKLPSASASTTAAAARTCLAFDLMVLRFKHLQWIPSLTPSFGWLFSEEDLKKYENGKDNKEKDE